MTWVDDQTKAWIESQGYRHAVAECRNGRVSRDLFGFIDDLGVGEGGTIAIQATDHTHFADRLKKVRANENLRFVLAAGWSVYVLGWRKGEREPHRLERVT